jgi:butyryl-CoA dehydrogenase
MDFEPDMSQRLLRDNLQLFLADHYAFEARRRAVATEPGWRPQFWKRLASELGVLGAGLPERVGGSGGGAVEHMIMMEAFGGALVVEPYLETCVIAGSLLANAGSDRADELLAAIADGRMVVTLAWAEPAQRCQARPCATRATRTTGGWRLDGHKAVVLAAPWADAFLVSADTDDGVVLLLIDRHVRGLSQHAFPTIDGRRAADLHFDNVQLPADALIADVDCALSFIERALDDGAAAVCAEALGVMARLLDDTVTYTRQRRQFGRAIAEFQTLQHRMVDMHLQIELSRAATVMATLSLSADARARAIAVSTAKVTVAQACRYVGQNAVQLHGGMGMTDELPLGSYFKRATVVEREFGDVDHHLQRHARLEAAVA